MTEAIRVRKSPIVVIKNLIAIQFIGAVTYLIASLLANYGEIYQSFTFSQIISYEIAKFLAVIFFELFLILFVFFEWLTASFFIHPDKVISESGVFIRRRNTFNLNDSALVTYQTNIFSRLFRYGKITLLNKKAGKKLVLVSVPNPKHYHKLINDNLKFYSYHSPESHGDLSDLLATREHEKLEFKSSLRWDRRQGKINKALEKAVLKTVAAFLNSEGGHLLIGIEDDGKLVGLEDDYKTLVKQNADGFENHFTNIFKSSIGPELRRHVQLSFHHTNDKEICLICVFPSLKPAYLKYDNEEAFYIRTGNSTTALQLSEVYPYIRTRWKN
jgi:hypothetical protein